MRTFDYIKEPEKLLTPEIVRMIGSIHEHKGKQELFLEANMDELKTLLEAALIQSTGASNRMEGIYTTDKRLEELVNQKAEPGNRSEQEIAGYREVLFTIHESYEYINPRPKKPVKSRKYRTKLYSVRLQGSPSRASVLKTLSEIGKPL